jgi:hypothetical protein
MASRIPFTRRRKLLWQCLTGSPTLTDEGRRRLSRVNAAEDNHDVLLFVPRIHVTGAGDSQNVQTSLLLKQYKTGDTHVL